MLRVAMMETAYQSLDPQNEYDSYTWELFRCCLARTLLSYPGQPASEGGAEVAPDLAVEMPSISGDGLEWTFQLKQGIHYGPPLEDVEVTTDDIVRALERMLRVTPIDYGNGLSNPRVGGYHDYDFYYRVIEGADAYAEGSAETISGLSTPNAYSLVVRLTEPTGDLGYRLALPAASPIPPIPLDPDAKFGIADGHDQDFGRFLVSTGPYMLEGSNALDFSAPASDQVPVSGFVPGKRISLVRNPSWERDTDALRGAFVHRIEVTIQRFPPPGPEFATSYSELMVSAAEQIEGGAVDLAFMQLPWNIYERYRDDPALRPRLRVETAPSIYYVSMNLAQPPFDDVNVRKAVNYVFDRAGVLDFFSADPSESEAPAIIAQALLHLAPDATEGFLLESYDPYPSGSDGGLLAAGAEMSASAYDRDGDGDCDDPVCRHVMALAFGGFQYIPPLLVSDALAQIGIELEVEVDTETFFERAGDPELHVPMVFLAGWGSDYPNATAYFDPLFRSTTALVGPYAFNPSLLGASPEQLAAWGYEIEEIESLDEEIAQCEQLTGNEQITCWAGLDQFAMETIVPWVPVLQFAEPRILSARIENYSLDAFTSLPALDRIALAPAPTRHP